MYIIIMRLRLKFKLVKKEKSNLQIVIYLSSSRVISHYLPVDPNRAKRASCPDNSEHSIAIQVLI